MDGLVSNAAMILLSLHPSPASETSAFNKIRAFRSR
jgi:uracil DNA glycosylase